MAIQINDDREMLFDRIQEAEREKRRLQAELQGAIEEIEDWKNRCAVLIDRLAQYG